MGRLNNEQIRGSLITQLKDKGIYKNHYIDLVDDYMSFWVIKSQLTKDIAERGVNIEYKNGRNQFGVKQNDSVLNLVKVNAQMLKILSELGLKGADQSGDIDVEL